MALCLSKLKRDKSLLYSYIGTNMFVNVMNNGFHGLGALGIVVVKEM